MDSGVPWRASAGPSGSSSLSLDQFCARRTSFEVSARFLGSNDLGSTFATPLSSMRHLDDVIDDLQEELSGLNRSSQARARGCLSGGNESQSPSRSLRPAPTAKAGAPPDSSSCITHPSSRRPHQPAQTHHDHQQAEYTTCGPASPGPPPCLPPSLDHTVLRAFLCDDDDIQPPQRLRSIPAERTTPPTPAEGPPGPHAPLPLQQPTSGLHLNSTQHPHHPCSTPAPLAASTPRGPQDTPLELRGLRKLRTASRTNPDSPRAAAPLVPLAIAAATGPAGAVDTCADAPDTPTRSRLQLGQVLSSGVLSSLRKTASDVVSQLRALGSSRNSRTGSRVNTVAATPTSVLASQQRPSGDHHWELHDDSGGTVAPAYSSRWAAPLSEVAMAPVALLQPAEPVAAAATVAAPPPPPLSAPSGSLASLRAHLDGSLGDSLTAPPSCWTAGAFSSSVTWGANGGGGRGSSSAVFASRGGPHGGPPTSFIDERQDSGGSALVLDMWDLAHILDELDDGFPPPPVAGGVPHRGGGGSSAPDPGCTAPTAPPPLPTPAKTHSAPGAGRPGAGRPGAGRPAESPAAAVAAAAAQPRLREQLRAAITPRAGVIEAAAAAAAASLGSVSPVVRGHEAEQLYVLSELVQQARASDGSVAPCGRAQFREAAALPFPQQQLPLAPLSLETLLPQVVAATKDSRTTSGSVGAQSTGDDGAVWLEGWTSPFKTAAGGGGDLLDGGVKEGEQRDQDPPKVGRGFSTDHGIRTGTSATVCPLDTSAALPPPPPLLPFSGCAATGGLFVADPLCASAPSRLAAPSIHATQTISDFVPHAVHFPTSQSSVSPEYGTAAACTPSSSISATPSVAKVPSTDASPAVHAAVGGGRAATEPPGSNPLLPPPATTAAVSGAGPRVFAQAGFGLYGISSGALGSGPLGSTSSGGLMEIGPELSMLWPLMMPTPMPAVLRGNPDDVEGSVAACRPSKAFLLNVLVACGCGSGCTGRCTGGCVTSSSGRAAAASSPMEGLAWRRSAMAVAVPSPSPAQTSVCAMLSGVQLAQVKLDQGVGGQAALLRLPLLPSMQLVNIFASSAADVGPAASLLAVPPAMAAELQTLFADKVERSLSGLMDKVASDAAAGDCQFRRRAGGPSSSGTVAATAAARSTVLQVQVRRDIEALRQPSPDAPPWSMSVPVWAACRTEWRSWMQPLLQDICYLLLCVPNCFAHGLVEWDQLMYCETLARLLGQLERYRLWQTISVLLEFCNRQGVALLYQGEAVTGAGSLSAERVRALLEGALHDEISIKAVGGGAGAAGNGGVAAGVLGTAAGGPAGTAMATLTIESGGGGGRGRRASVAALVAPDAADAAAALTLQAWQRRSIDGPASYRMTMAAASASSAVIPSAADVTGAAAIHAASRLGHDLGQCPLSATTAASAAGSVPASGGIAATAHTSPFGAPDEGNAMGAVPVPSGRRRSRSPPSQASLSRALGRVLALLANGEAVSSSPAGQGAGVAATGRGGGVAGAPTAAGVAHLYGGTAGGMLPQHQAPPPVVAPVGAAPHGGAGERGQRLGHMIENAAVVLAFAGLMLQSLL